MMARNGAERRAIGSKSKSKNLWPQSRTARAPTDFASGPSHHPLTTEFVPRKHAICRCLAGVRSFPFQTQSVLDVYARTDHVLHIC